MAEKPDFDKIFANKATSVHEWDKDDYDTGWGFLGETPPPYELFDSLQRENDTKTKYLYERAEEINTDLTQDINNLQSDLNSKYSELKTGLGSTNTALQQHNVDENAHANLFKRALVTEAKTATNTADWNTLTESRTYKISGATFTADKHQPVGAVGTGELVVLKNGDDTIAQVYYANSAAYDKAGAYHRMCIGGAWTGWVYNITNKGGTIENNLQIDGKLVVPNVYVTEKLLIGSYDPTQPEQPDTSNFLTKDDLQTLQNRIIDPVQIIYVSNSGSDETGTGTSKKPYRTINKAVENINRQIPKISIFLDCRTSNQTYDVTPIDFYREKLVERLEIQPWTINTKYRATLYVNYGKVQVMDDTTAYGGYPARYAWGNILFSSFTYGEDNNITLYLYDIDIRLGGQKNSDREAKFLVACSNLILEECSVDIGNHYLYQPVEGVNGTVKSTNTETSIIGSLIGNKFDISDTDPYIGDPENKVDNVNKLFTLIRLHFFGSGVPDNLITSGGLGENVRENAILDKYISK